MPDSARKSTLNRYGQVIEAIFFAHYQPGMREVPFDREEIAGAAHARGFELKNVGDLVYSFRYRMPLPPSVEETAGPDKVWVIRSCGSAKYCFMQETPLHIQPNPALAETKVPDATPGVIAMYAQGDEQALLAKLRYNRLIDIFTGVACYSLQNHLRTQVPGIGQIETDEIYVGIDRRGAHFVFPVQAKGGKEQLGRLQMEQDIAMCRAKFPALICRPIGAQFAGDDLIAMFEFEATDEGIRIGSEKHYRLVPSDEVSPDDLRAYANRADS